MTDCNHSEGICDNRWATEGQPCCEACAHVGSGPTGNFRTPARIGRVRDSLERIAELCLVIPAAAAEQGRDTTTHAVLAGPVPELSTYLARRHYVLSGNLCQCGTRGQVCPDDVTIEGPTCESVRCGHRTCLRIAGVRSCPDLVDWLEQADDTLHPLWVLGTWDMAVAEHLGHTRRFRVTVADSAGYLDRNLTDLARHGDFGFDEMADDIHACLRHVEAVLNVGIHVERGAPCPVCHGEGRKAQQLEREYGALCEVESHDHADEAPDDECDLWTCPASECGQVWTVEQYGKYVEGEYVQHADRLTAAQLQDAYRINPSTLRTWAERERVKKRGKDRSGRMLYDVADALKARDEDALVGA